MHLAQTGTAFVVATVRTGEPCPDAVVWLWKDAGAPRVELGLLTGPETGAPAEAVADGALAMEDGLWQLTARPSVSTSLAEPATGSIARMVPVRSSQAGCGYDSGDTAQAAADPCGGVHGSGHDGARRPDRERRPAGHAA